MLDKNLLRVSGFLYEPRDSLLTITILSASLSMTSMTCENLRPNSALRRVERAAKEVIFLTLEKASKLHTELLAMPVDIQYSDERSDERSES